MLSTLCKKHLNLLHRILSVVLVFLACRLNAQVFYSSNPEYLKSKHEQNNLGHESNIVSQDTLINDLSNFLPRNFLGNAGLPSPDYLLKYGTDPLGFRLLNSPYSNARFHEHDVQYFNTLGPFADLTGIGGSKQLQVFKLLFTGTYSQRFNVTLRLNRYTSQGFYNKQQSFTNNFYTSSNYTATNNRIGYYFYFLNNSNKNQENGGLADGSLNDSTVLINKELITMRLSSANRDNKEAKVMINPWYRLNKFSDSLSNLNHYLQLKTLFSTASLRYRDEGIRKDNFYKYVFLDTTKTKDSTHVKMLVNELNYTLKSPCYNTVFSGGYRNEISQLWQKSDSVFMNHIVQSEFSINKKMFSEDSLRAEKGSFRNRLQLQYVLLGPNAKDYKVENKAIFSFNPHRSAFLNVLIESRQADHIYNSWLSNHFRWSNNGFDQTNQAQVKAGIDLDGNKGIAVFYQNIFNYLYFNAGAQPAQFNQTIQNAGFEVNYTSVFFKHLGVSVNYIYQFTSHAAYIRLPSNVGRMKLFYNGNFFKNNLQLQFGTQLQVYDAFNSYAYMPATQVFYIQESFKTTPYPFLDFYLHARVRPVSVFVKVENALQGLAGNNYAFVPGYYQPDRAVSLGLKWVFYD